MGQSGPVSRGSSHCAGTCGQSCYHWESKAQCACAGKPLLSAPSPRQDCSSLRKRCCHSECGKQPHGWSREHWLTQWTALDTLVLIHISSHFASLPDKPHEGFPEMCMFQEWLCFLKYMKHPAIKTNPEKTNFNNDFPEGLITNSSKYKYIQMSGNPVI